MFEMWLARQLGGLSMDLDPIFMFILVGSVLLSIGIVWDHVLYALGRRSSPIVTSFTVLAVPSMVVVKDRPIICLLLFVVLVLPVVLSVRHLKKFSKGD